MINDDNSNNNNNNNDNDNNYDKSTKSTGDYQQSMGYVAGLMSLFFDPATVFKAPIII